MKHTTLIRYNILIASLVLVGSAFAERGLLRQRREAVRSELQNRAATVETAPVIAPATVIANTPNLNVPIPSGVNVMVTLRTSLDSSKHAAGQVFTGVLVADIVNGSNLIAAKGGKVFGQVVNAKQPRNIGGQSSLELQLTGIMVGSQQRAIESAKLLIQSSRTGGDTLRKTAGAAAIGGLADGSDGAEAGAKIGGAASLLSKGQTASVAAGTTLSFLIGPPGSGLANQVSQETLQPQEKSVDRSRDRRDTRGRRRR